jgi:hypothetical protein
MPNLKAAVAEGIDSVLKLKNERLKEILRYYFGCPSKELTGMRKEALQAAVRLRMMEDGTNADTDNVSAESRQI